MQSGVTPFAHAVYIIRGKFKLRTEDSIRVFNARTGSELRQVDNLTETTYMITIGGANLGDHPLSIYGAVTELTSGPKTSFLLVS